MKRHNGFTLTEVMITVVIVAILASIAIPSYTDYVRRSQLAEATSELANARVQMEQYYQDNRSYANGAGCGVANKTVKNFTLTCTLNTTAGAPAGQSYRFIATGRANTLSSAFRFDINEQNLQRTTAVYTGYGTVPQNCWITKKGATC